MDSLSRTVEKKRIYSEETWTGFGRNGPPGRISPELRDIGIVWRLAPRVRASQCQIALTAAATGDAEHGALLAGRYFDQADEPGRTNKSIIDTLENVSGGARSGNRMTLCNFSDLVFISLFFLLF
jgi:hypothetical protein